MSNIKTPAISGQAVCGQTICGQININEDISRAATDHGDNPKVNLTTGRLLYIHPDLSIGANSFEINIAHVYNSMIGNSTSTRFQGVGNGWKLNVHQYIERVDDDNYNYIDSIGYIHRLTRFDSINNRFYSTDESKLILKVSLSEAQIKDELGNIIKFNANGNISQTISCQNESAIQNYIYNSAGKLVEIYDSRLRSGNITKNNILFNYENAMLKSISANYENTKKAWSCDFTYNNGNLIKIRKTKYDKTTGAVLTTKTKTLCTYGSNGRLFYVADTETKSAVLAEYNASGRILRLNKGSVQISADNITSFSAQTFLQFAYGDPSNAEYETTVTTEKNVVTSYFSNNRGQITSIFEKEGNNYNPINSEQGAVCDFYGTDIMRINGISVKTFSSSGASLNAQLLNTASLYGGKKCKYMYLTGWIKHNILNESKRLNVRIGYRCSTSPATYYTAEEVIGSGNSWQQFAIPFSMNGTTQTDSISSMMLSIVDTFGTSYAGSIGGCRIVPGIDLDEYLINTNDGITHYGINPKTINKVKIYQTSGISTYDCLTSTEVFFTMSDILESTKNAKVSGYLSSGNSCYDLICCNGKKRLANVIKVEFNVSQGTYAWALSTQNSSFSGLQIKTDIRDTSFTGITHVDHSIQADCILYTTTVSVQNSNGMVNSISQLCVDHKGKTVYEVDAYNTRTEYTYNDYGELTDVIERKTGQPDVVRYNATHDNIDSYVIKNIPDKDMSGNVTYTQHEYWSSENRIYKERHGSNILEYWYTADIITSLDFNGSEYTYNKNNNGDVLAILDSQGVSVVQYAYDELGNPTIYAGNTKIYDPKTGIIEGYELHIGNLNPFRYRGCYYDPDTGLYSNSSYGGVTYYDPGTGQTYAPVITQVEAGQCLEKPFWYRFIETKTMPIESITQRGGLPVFLFRINPLLGVGYYALGFQQTGGVYFIAGGIQKYFGYCDFYDTIFRIFCDMDKDKFQVTCDGEEYMFWVWKADYLNLGAGAELGIYHNYKRNILLGQVWQVDESVSQHINMKLYYNGNEIINRTETTWWMTGFDSNNQGARPHELTAVFTINFNTGTGDKLERNRRLYNALRSKWQKQNSPWTFNNSTYVATLTF